MMRKLFFSSCLILLAVLVLKLQFTSSQKPIDPEAITGEYNLNDTSGIFLNDKVTTSDIPEVKTSMVLGTSNKPKRIEVDLTNQRLYAFEGDQKVYDFLISSGKWGKTPTGTFSIWGKFRYTKMEGGRKELNTYYYLPNVPYVMFFANDKVPAYRGFGLHGTYWHSNFGHPMSHGCINMKTEDAGLIYNWSEPVLGDKKSVRASDTNPGTTILIYGVAPKS